MPRQPLIWPWLLLLLLLVAGGIAAALLLTRDGDTKEADRGRATTIFVSQGPGRTQVPRVVGLSAARALERLQAAGLKGRTVKVASRRPKDQVLKQSRAPGTELTKDSVVVLTTARGPTATTSAPTGRRVPHVVGLAQRVAVARLQNAGFRADSYPARSRRPRGTVIAQGPPGGARAVPSTVVRIDISLGSGRRPLRTVPDVVGMTEAQAKRVLVQAGFTVRSVDQAAADSSEKDVVLDQRPAAGGSRPTASQLIIVVGRFPPPAT